MDIPSSVANLRERVDEVTIAAGRAAGSVAILGVTKMQSREAVIASIEAGLTDVGENYFQEARDKFVGLPAVRTHFIGHMQTNKAKPIAALFDVVQSVDRLEAGLALVKAVHATGKPVRALIQINISPSERFGIAPADAAGIARQLRSEGLDVDGVMAIGPLDGGVDEAFALAARTFAEVGGTTLSLGMSADWERAIAHGSTMIRIGSASFGPRPARESALV
jgi:pyridoxal phosphate enzyme (YggS family)